MTVTDAENAIPEYAQASSVRLLFENTFLMEL